MPFRFRLLRTKLSNIFQREPSKGISDCLDCTARVEDVMMDLTGTIKDITISAPGNNNYSSLTESENEDIKKQENWGLVFQIPLGRMC
jgi:hypothetical protein